MKKPSVFTVGHRSVADLVELLERRTLAKRHRLTPFLRVRKGC